jgi:hypothetical protein
MELSKEQNTPLSEATTNMETNVQQVLEQIMSEHSDLPYELTQTSNRASELAESLDTIPQGRVQLSSDELLSLAELLLHTLKQNPLPVELSLPYDVTSLKIPGTPDNDDCTSLGTLDKSLQTLCDALEFKTSVDGRFIAELFVELPSKEEYPDYHTIIQHPIAISVIRQNRYDSVQDMVRDFARMFKNARTYNTKGSVVYQDSIVLQMEFARQFSKLFPDEAKELDQLLGDASLEKESKAHKSKKIPAVTTTVDQLQVEESNDSRTRRNPSRPKHSWLKRKREDNFFVYGSGSETDKNSDADTDKKKKKKSAVPKSYEVHRKGKAAGDGR